MILPIVRKEARELLRSDMVAGSVAIAGVLLVLAAIEGTGTLRAQAVERRAASEVHRERWLERDAVNAHVAAHAGTTLYRPPSPLSAVDPGLDRYLGISVFLEAHRINPFQEVRAAEGVPAQRLGVLSVAFVLQVVVPLLVVLLTFGAFAREREVGVLRLALSQGASPGRLALGKLLALSAVLLLAVAPGATTVLLLLPQAIVGPGGAVGSRSDLLVRAGAMALVYVGYLLVFLLLGLAVSARSRSSARALTLLLGLWFFQCLAIPRLVVQTVQEVRPTPSGYGLRAAIDRDQRASTDYFDLLEQGAERLTTTYGVSTAEELPVNLRGYALMEGEREATEVMRHHYGRLHAGFEAQQALYRLAGVVSPTVPVQLLSMALAGSDLSTFLEFDRQAEEYRTLLVGVMNDHDMYELPSGTSGFAVPQDELYARVPEFAYAAPRWPDALRDERGSLMLLLGWVGGTLLVAGWSVRSLGRSP